MSLDPVWDDLQRRFLDHLMEIVAAREIAPQNPEAYALFAAVESAFMGYAGRDSYNVTAFFEVPMYLGGFGCSLMRGEGDLERGVLGDVPNHFLHRVYEGLFVTIRDGIKEKKLRQLPEGPYYGCLRLPEWLVEHFTREANAEEIARREFRKKYPFTPCLVHSTD